MLLRLSAQIVLQLHLKMVTLGLCLLFLLLFGRCQRAVSQITEWIGVVEGSGKMSCDAVQCDLFFCSRHVSELWDREHCKNEVHLSPSCS